MRRGVGQVVEALRWVRHRFNGGMLLPEDIVSFESGDLAYTVGFERGEVSVDGNSHLDDDPRDTHLSPQRGRMVSRPSSGRFPALRPARPRSGHRRTGRRLMSAAINLRPALAQRESPVRLIRRPAEMPAAHLGAPEAISAPTRAAFNSSLVRPIHTEGAGREDDLSDLQFVTGNAEMPEVSGSRLSSHGGIVLRWACPEARRLMFCSWTRPRKSAQRLRTPTEFSACSGIME